ncbi:MAG: UDP-N-acetylmuramoyl-L-alanine--D-glutamate ligase [Mycobacteriales bacterium]
MPVVVAGAGVSGTAVVRALLDGGAVVTVLDPGRALPADLTARVATRVVTLTRPPPGTRLVVASPGLRPAEPLLRAAARAGIDVISEVEFAWRIAPAPRRAAWLAVTGTNGKTTTVGMLAAILAASGHRSTAAGNIGPPLTEAVRAEPPYDVLAVELSSQQLHYSPSIAPAASAVLNIAPDHLDWHGSFEGYVADKRRIFHRDATNVFNADDPAVRVLADGLPDTVGFTLGEPAPGALGVVGDRLVDRAFGVRVGDTAHPCGGAELRVVGELTFPGRHNVANALAAAALARAYGLPARAVGVGLRGYQSAPHRNVVVGRVRGVSYVDDSKATNPHAAAASLAAYRRVVWVAGGLLKGVDVDPLVASVTDRLAGVVLLGADRELIAHAIARHAPGLPVVKVHLGDDRAMVTAVRAAARLARPGDTVLLAPAAASFDMFTGFAARGDAFAAAVRALAQE